MWEIIQIFMCFGIIALGAGMIHPGFGVMLGGFFLLIIVAMVHRWDEQLNEGE